MRLILTITFCCFFIVSGKTQIKNIDSLSALLKNSSKPIERFDLLSKIYEQIYNNSFVISSKSTDVALQMHSIARKTQNDSLLAITNNLIGSIFRDKQDPTTALKYYFAGVPLAAKAQDKRRLSSLYFDIAAVYFILGKNAEGLAYIKKGGANLPHKSSPMYNFMAFQYHSGMWEYYFIVGQYEKALLWLRNAESHNLQLKNEKYNHSIISAYANTYRKLGDLDMAGVYYRKSTILVEQSGDPFLIAEDKFFQGRYLIATNRIDEATANSHNMLKIAKAKDYIFNKRVAASFLKDIYLKSNNIDSAFHYLNMESQLKDSIQKLANLEKIKTLDFQEQMRDIEEKANVQILEEERQQNIQYAIIALSIVNFLIVFLLLSRSVIVNENTISFFGILGLLIVFEFINLIMHPFLERITHHSPILMLIALVILASILIPVHHKLEKWIKGKLIEKNKAIRLAAAKRTIDLLESSTNA
jgi:tetratricopeptide (TPR) repeat protein